MKYCTKCNKSKDLSEFRPNSRKKDGYQHYCIECDKEYQKEWYKANSEKAKRRAKIHNKVNIKRNKDFIIDYLKKNPCAHCGESDIVVLEFDHLSNKEYGIATLANSSLEKIKTEISKCQVLCANCHKRKTAKDFNWYKLK